MKALFLIFHGLSAHNGISKKIHSQVEALRQNGFDTQFCYLRFNPDGSHTRMIDDTELETYPNSIGGKIRKRTAYQTLIDYVQNHRIDLVYIRGANNSSPFTISLIRKLKQGGTRVVYEIPTFPYDGEFKASSRKNKLRLQLDKLCRRTQAQLLDYIVTYANVPQIFGAPTICISNGIDFDKIPVKQQRRPMGGEFHLIGVAELHFWHGFDRVIRGMAEYYKDNPKVKVVFHIVGYGTDGTLQQLQQLVRENNLEEYVIFHGPQYGPVLDEIFETADMGVASLGRHRSNITDIKTLKNREYAARGIPFVYSESDSDFDGKSYIFKAPADESAVRTTDLIAFYNAVAPEPQQIRASIAALSWKTQMQKVTDRIFTK